MEKKNRTFIHLEVIMALVLIFTCGCKKDNVEITYGSMTDQAGNIYKTVEIGTQTWMAENLKTIKLNDNSSIPNVTSNSSWISLTTPGYCWFNNDEATNKPVYGALYNWYAAKSGKLCPTGWHVPSDTEFKTMEMFLGLTQTQADATLWRGTDQGKRMKSATGWKDGENGSNTTGFSALPGGYRYHLDGAFNNLGDLGYWWSTSESDPTQGNYRRLDGNNNGVYRDGTVKKAGKSVRCVKD